MKKIVFTKHSKESMRKRGVSEDEVKTAIAEASLASIKVGKA